MSYGYSANDSNTHELVTPLPQDEIDAIEQRRVEELEESGIDEQAVISGIHKFMGAWTAYFQENNTAGKDDLEFLYRDQWTSLERSEFQRVFKPCLVINKLYDPFRKIIGEQRKNTPDIKIRSLTGKASQESINLHTDMLKRIAYSSRTKVIYQQCFQSSMSFSYGAFLVKTQYESSDSFFQEIVYEWQQQPESCFWDPRATECHKGDGNYCGFNRHMTVEEYESRWPNIPNPKSFADAGNMVVNEWYSADTVTICDYWVKEWYTKILYYLDNGETVTKEEYEELEALHKKTTKHVGSMNEEIADKLIEGMLPPLPEVLQERVTDDYIIMHYRCTADKILEFTEWPSRFLPLVFVDGDSYYEEGQQFTRTFIKQSKDAQRQLNYIACEIAAQIKNGSRAQWLATPDNVKGKEWMWVNPEVQQGALIADPDQKTGEMPVRQQASEVPQSLFIQYQRATSDIKETLGYYDANVAANANDISGVAIDNRSIQGAGSTAVFFDNLNRAVEQGARISLDLLPTIYDTERTLTLTRGNGEQYTITINQDMGNGQVQNQIQGNEFDLELDAGPSFAVQEKQAMEMLLAFAQTNPQVFPLVADLIAKNMDLPFAQQLAERFKTVVPPAVLAKEQGLPPPPAPPNPQEMVMQKQMQLADAKLQDQKQELQLSQQRLDLERQQGKLKQAQLMLDMQELQHKMRESAARDTTENHKAELSFSADMARIIAQLQKETSVKETNSAD